MGALNRIVEEVAKNQVEDVIVMLELLSEQIIATSKTAKTNQITFNTPSTSNADMNKKLLESSTVIKQLKQQIADLQNGYAKLEGAAKTYATAQGKLNLENRQKIIDDREVRKGLDQEAVANSNLTSYIQKLTAERAKAISIVQSYNASVAMGNTVTAEQTASFKSAETSFKKLDTAIKAGKNSVGDFKEDVGNYAKGASNLSNSIGQISRELPNFGQSFSIGILSLTNNIGALQDGIKQVRLQNLALEAEGKQTTSVLSQIGSSIFSWNTLLYISIGLFSAFSKEIVLFFEALGSGVKTLNEGEKALIGFNEAQEKGVINTKNELQTYREYVSIAGDKSLGYEKQKIAIDHLRSSYPGYLKSLSDEQIMKIKGSEVDKQIESVLGYGERYKANLQEIQSINEKIEVYKAEIKARLEYNDSLKEQQKIISEGTSQGFQGATVETAAAQAAEKEIYILKEREKIRKASIKDEIVANSTIGQLQEGLQSNLDIYNSSLKVSQVLKDKSILLEAKETDKVKENTKARQDYLASEYELLHLRLTNITNANKAILNDDASSYELRSMAAEQYYGNLVDLANMEAKEELRVLKFNTDEKLRTTASEYSNQKDQLDKSLTDGKLSTEQYNKGLKIANNQFQYDKVGVTQEAANKEKIIYENLSQHLIEANKATVGELAKIWDNINFGKANIEIGNIDLTNIQKLGESLKGVLEGITKDTSSEEIQRQLQKVSEIAKNETDDINKRKAKVSLDEAEASKKRIENAITENGIVNGLSEDQIKEQLVNNEDLQNADLAIIDSKKAVAEADNAITQTQIDNAKRLKEEQGKVNDAIYNGKMELYGSIKDLSGQLFENQINDYDRQIEKSNDYYDKLIANSEKGSEQEQLLQEEKQRKEEELQKRKIEIQRKQAIFNKLLAIVDIGIKLQAEIATNNAQLGTLPAIPVNGLAIASAGIRVATVLATPLPQYKGGRGIGKDELAVVGDGGVSEVIQRGDGNIELTPNKPTLAHLKPTDIVHSSLENFQKSKFALENAAIMASFSNQHDSLKRFDYYLGRELNGISGKIERGIEKGFKKAQNNIYLKLPPIHTGSNGNRAFR